MVDTSAAKLNSVLKYFKRNQGVTAQELQEGEKLPKSAVYALINAIKSADVELTVQEERTGKRGAPRKRYFCQEDVHFQEPLPIGAE